MQPDRVFFVTFSSFVKVKMKEWKQPHENKHLITHEQVASRVVGFSLHESTEETPICSPGSDGVVNSFKNSGKTETKYLCPAVIFCIRLLLILLYS